jgi:hypothetical protein
MSSNRQLQAVVNHILLPPNIPGSVDPDLHQLNLDLIARFQKACEELRRRTNGDFASELDHLSRSLRHCHLIHASHCLDSHALEDAFQNLGEGGILIIHVIAQNAGILVRRGTHELANRVIFEAFEVSPRSADVLTSKDTLQWDFPTSAAAIPTTVFEDRSFQRRLANFLERASAESIKEFGAFSKKANSDVCEPRDTADPALITSLLITLLEGIGEQLVVSPIRKRVRDEVRWKERIPWRRSPLWLLLRVGVLRNLTTSSDPDVAHALYKIMMCMIHAHLLSEIVGCLNPETSHLLLTKLCRRLTKVEHDKSLAGSDSKLSKSYTVLLGSVRLDFLQHTNETSRVLWSAWNSYKQRISRAIHPMRVRLAAPMNFRLSLTNSSQHHEIVRSCPLSKNTVVDTYVMPTKYREFYQRYCGLTEIELREADRMSDMPSDITACEIWLIQQAGQLLAYLSASANSYGIGTEECSHMILTVMWMWMLIDKSLNRLFPALYHFKPVFQPTILDCLRLSRQDDLGRLQELQQYLLQRHLNSTGDRTIFDNPTHGCFAEKYYDYLPSDSELHQLRRKKEERENAAVQKKQDEWTNLDSDHELLMREISSITCQYVFTGDFMIPEHAENCRKCALTLEAETIRIKRIEKRLPYNQGQWKAVLFELLCPEPFSAYREATWRIVVSLGLPEARATPKEPLTVLHDYYRDFNGTTAGSAPTNKRGGGFPCPTLTLGSKSKSFLQTHFRHAHFPVPFEQVCVNNGLKFEFYDAASKMWPAEHSRAVTFDHHCAIPIPQGSPFSKIEFPTRLMTSGGIPQMGVKFIAANAVLESSEILAQQSCCSRSLGIQEFVAFQGLICGLNRFWPALLVEMGSSNLNFSSEAVMLMLRSLCTRTGPTDDQGLHVQTVVFHDDTFCNALVSQIDKRLNSIRSNSRENSCMEILITLILKLLELGTTAVRMQALHLLNSARETAIHWTRLVRREYWSTTDVFTSRRLSQCILWAALLCKRTFAHLESKATYSDLPVSIDESSLSVFIEASISVHDNLPESPATLPSVLQSALIRDLQMVYCLQGILQHSLKVNPQSLILAATGADIISARSCENSFGQVTFIAKTDGVWAGLKLSSNQHMDAQDIEFHLLSGVLLVDGKTVLKELPLTYCSSEAIRQVFPFQRLRVSPSSLRGMTYKLGFPIEGHEVHLGLRNGELVIRAWAPGNAGMLLEFIPTSVYGNGSSFDLPASLVENCVHWLDIRENVVEIRRSSMIWRSLDSNWRIDLSSRTAYRHRRMHMLIDSRSNLFNHVTGSFRGFEDPYHILLYQPQRGALVAGLPRYDLAFYVNSNGLLESQELRAEIDPNQDAGVWYGLVSKLILRDIHNPQKRSIVVPLGPIKVERKGVHVEVRIRSEEALYGRFFLDEVLGRVTCATEPRLFYTKALIHASTSFCLPDPLTGKTGTEEACHILQSGGCQPYTPLTPINIQILDCIAAMTPLRQFHPPELGVLETVTWNALLPTGMQDDRFKHLVDLIKAKSELLLEFELNDQSGAQVPPSTIIEHLKDHVVSNDHLTQRSQSRRQMFQRQQFRVVHEIGYCDMAYAARGYAEYDMQQNYVFQAAYLLQQWPTRLPSPHALLILMQTWPHIEGFGEGTLVYDKLRLSDQLETDLASSWGSLINLFRLSGEDAKYMLLFLTACLCFKKDVNIHAIQTLIAFAVLKDLKVVDLPSWPYYTQFRPGFIPKEEYLKPLLQTCGKKFSTDATAITQRPSKAVYAAKKVHDARVEQEIGQLLKSICDQWPCAQPIVDKSSTVLIDHEIALSLIAPVWHAMVQNHEFDQHLRQVQLVLDKSRTSPPKRDTKHWPRKSGLVMRRAAHLMHVTLLKRVIRMNMGWKQERPPPLCIAERVCPESETNELRQIIAELPQSRSIVRTEYIRGLQQSITALQKTGTISARFSQPRKFTQVDSDVTTSQHKVAHYFERISSAFRKGVPGSEWIQNTELWPFPRERSLLETLSTSLNLEIDDSVKEAIIQLGLLITQLQRLLRIQDAVCQQNSQLLEEELANPGHSNWSPKKYPDWLLLEIEANVLVRPVQADVALATITGASGSNSVLQLNMGQGKTSIIIPLVASVLANGSSLCRIIVPKALLLQTAQLIQSRLGGLLQREVRHIPFSRRTPCTLETIKAYADIHQDMLKKCGVIIALPEHLMSFMLSGPQRSSDQRIAEAKPMVKFQLWLGKTCRDVLDECDFTMAVKTQLIYPSGPQATVDGARYRWETIEAILHLVESHLHGLQLQFSSSIQVVHRQQGGFPFIYFLRSDAQDALMKLVFSDICSGKTSVLKLEGFSVPERRAIKLFMSEARPQKSVADCVVNISRGNPSAGFVIYLVRGLIVHRILLLCLSRRWNVQYGLHPARDPVAVPFHAKGIPSNLAEWGHVDVSLLFTCLSFYYQGLSQDQLRKSLEQILKSDDPAREFEEWIQGSESLSGQYRDWTALNLEDASQLESIWRHVRFNTAAIDYFLNNFVFPKHAKQFQVKLQASGWDLPLKGEGANITTGFSGTNDNRLILPLTIRQHDLPALAHTNAEVLTYLLQTRNRGYSLLGRRVYTEHGLLFHRFSEDEFLSKLRHKGIKILIDSGASILEMTNHALAKKWLEIDTTAPAAIYFDENNRAMVTYRGRKTLPLLASPFANNLSDCLVYIDESHSRGTDLKFSPDAHGAVTLSLGQTKDQTVQAVMRLRQLGTTQSVTFFAPPEVHQSIMDFRGKTARDHIDSHDTICWLLEQTIQGLENLQPLYYAQGSDFCRRSQAKIDYPDFLSKEDHRSSCLKVLQEPEQQTLKSLYEPRPDKAGRGQSPHKISGDRQIAKFMRELKRHRRAFQDTGNAVHASALQEVEQEREVAVEAESIRERQNPVHFHPQSFSGLDDDIRAFVKSGELRTGSMACQQVFLHLRHTSIGQKYMLNLPANSRLFVSLEFRKTVYTPSGKYDDNFLRPIQYMLWSGQSETAILVSPEEAELLIPICRRAAKQSVHLLTYSAPVTRKMLQFNDMNYYAIPPLAEDWIAPQWLQVQVGLFAGRLYLPFAELTHVLEFLGITNDESREQPSHEQQETDILPLDVTKDFSEDQEPIDSIVGAMAGKQTRAQLAKVRMLNFLHEWLELRAKGQDFAQTPMGYVCSGKVLTEEHPFFRGIDGEARTHLHAASSEITLNQGQSKDAENDAISDIDCEDLHERQRLTDEEMKRAEALKDEEEIFVDAEKHLDNDNDDDDDSSDNDENE